MKKLSLILALMLVLTCGVFAACSDDADTSSTASTEPGVSKTESKEESKTESKEESKDDSSEASSDVSEDNTSVPEINVGTENLAAGKTYTASEQYRQGGADVQWGWDDNAPYAYPDEDGKALTDGIKPAEGSDMFTAEWAAWTGQHPKYAEEGIKFTIDLGEVMEIAKVDVWYGTQTLQNGVVAPAGIEVLVSEDGTNFTSVGSVTPEDSNSVTNMCASVIGVASGRYVQINVVSGNWAFFSEIEIFAPAAEADETSEVVSE